MTYNEFCEQQFGYKTLTTYFMDFSIAEKFGKKAIIDTYENAMKYAKTNYKYLVELCMVLNHKIWFTYEKNEPLARIYDELWKKCDNYCCTHLKGEELKYFYRVTD